MCVIVFLFQFFKNLVCAHADYSTQIAEKQESIASLNAEITSINANIDTLKADLKDKKVALKTALFERQFQFRFLQAIF